LQECRGRRVVFRAYEKTLPNGRRVLVDDVIFPNSVAVLPVYRGGEPEVVLVKQYRPTIDKWTLEAPAGTIMVGESPEEAAVRELEEEAGLRAETLEKVAEGYTSPGYSREYMTLFIAWEPRDSSMRPESYEVIEGRVRIKLAEALRMISRASITDVKTILLVYAAFAKLHGG